MAKNSIRSESIRFSARYIPSKFALEHLIVSDNMGHISSNDFLYERLTYDNWLILFVIKGTFHIEQYGQHVTLHENQGVFMKLSDAHKYYSDKIEGTEFYWLHVNGTPLIPIVHSLTKYKFFPLLFEDSQIIHQFQQCFHLIDGQEPNFEYELSTHLYQMVLQITTPYLAHIETSIAKEHSWFVSAVETYVENHIEEKITLQLLGDHFNMSAFYFSKVFTNYFTMSPMQYVLTQKIQFSKHLLEEDTLSIQEIAHSLGFSDQSHFTKTFKKNMGVSPFSYRKMKR